MELLLTSYEAQHHLREQLRAKRLGQGLTQDGLAGRAGVSLATLRKFEQKGVISLTSFLKLLTALGCLEDVIKALEDHGEIYRSIDDVLKNRPQKQRRYGWRK